MQYIQHRDMSFIHNQHLSLSERSSLLVVRLTVLLIEVFKCVREHSPKFINMLFSLNNTWWRHQMETFSALLAFVRGIHRWIHRWPVNSPHKGQWRGALMFSLICALNKRLSKQSGGWWFETPSRSLWRHCNEVMWYTHWTIVLSASCKDNQAQDWSICISRSRAMESITYRCHRYGLLWCIKELLNYLEGPGLPLWTWWRHQMETFSALLAICAGNSPVTGEFPTQWPVTRSFFFFDLHLDKPLSKQSWCWLFEMPSRPLWRHSDIYCTLCAIRNILIDIKFLDF